MATYAEMLVDAKDQLARMLQSEIVKFEVGTGSGGAQQGYTLRDIDKQQKLVGWLETKAAEEAASEASRGRTVLAVWKRS